MFNRTALFALAAASVVGLATLISTGADAAPGGYGGGQGGHRPQGGGHPGGHHPGGHHPGGHRPGGHYPGGHRPGHYPHQQAYWWHRHRHYPTYPVRYSYPTYRPYYQPAPTYTPPTYAAPSYEPAPSYGCPAPAPEPAAYTPPPPAPCPGNCPAAYTPPPPPPPCDVCQNNNY
jgi:hypothetical protein